MSYVGHGQYKGWGKSCSIFQTASPTDPGGTREDLDDLATDSPLSFQVHANCITGHFPADSSVGSLNDSWYTFVEDWLTTARKGIVGGFAPAHLTYLQEIDSLVAPFYDEIYGRRKERVAARIDARIRAELATFNNVTGLRSFVLEGDPALRLAVPAPATPSITSIVQAGTRALTVTWTAVSGAASYRVFRSTTPGGPYTQAGQTAATSLTDGALTNCREYFYYVVAVDSNGFESRWSNFNDTCYGDRSDCRSGIPENPSGPAARRSPTSRTRRPAASCWPAGTPRPTRTARSCCTGSSGPRRRAERRSASAPPEARRGAWRSAGSRTAGPTGCACGPRTAAGRGRIPPS